MTMVYLSLDRVRVVAQGHITPRMLIDRNDANNAPGSSVMTDRNNDTCIPITMANKPLQAVFSFPSSNIGALLSVGVLMKHTETCTSPAWTWFVESECAVGRYRECSRKLWYHEGSSWICQITCTCFFSCDYLYLKLSRVSRYNVGEICEVRLFGWSWVSQVHSYDVLKWLISLYPELSKVSLIARFMGPT